MINLMRSKSKTKMKAMVRLRWDNVRVVIRGSLSRTQDRLYLTPDKSGVRIFVDERPVSFMEQANGSETFEFGARLTCFTPTETGTTSLPLFLRQRSITSA
jgi:hypothetical protein